MPVFAFTAGSLGDIMATAGLAAQVATVFYDNRHISDACESLSAELQTLHQVLLLTNDALQRYESTPLGTPLFHSIQPEVAECYKVLKKCSDDIDSCRKSLMTTSIGSLWRRLTWTVTDEPAALRAKLSSHRSNLALILLSLNTIGLLDVQQSRIGVLTEARWIQHAGRSFPKRILNSTISVVDQLGDTIPIPAMFSSSWESFHSILKAYAQNRIGQKYIEQGEFQMISSGNNKVIERSAFGRLVREGDTLEISIVLVLQTTGNKDQQRECPKCSYVNAAAASVDDSWVQCFRCSAWFCIQSQQQSSEHGLDKSNTRSLDDERHFTKTERVAQDSKLSRERDVVLDTKFFRRLTLQLQSWPSSAGDSEDDGEESDWSVDDDYTTFSRAGSSTGRRSRSNSIVTRERRDRSDYSLGRESVASLRSVQTDKGDDLETPGQFVSPIPPPSSADMSKYNRDAKLLAFPGFLRLEQERRKRLSKDQSSIPALSLDSSTQSDAHEDAHAPATAQSFSDADATSNDSEYSPILPTTLPGIKEWLRKNLKKKAIDTAPGTISLSPFPSLDSQATPITTALHS